MNKLLTLTILYSVLLCPIFATECSEYIESIYKQTYECSAHITVKKEFSEENIPQIGIYLPTITYGYGDLKSHKCKKHRISYICMFNQKFMPVWGGIINR